MAKTKNKIIGVGVDTSKKPQKVNGCLVTVLIVLLLFLIFLFISAISSISNSNQLNSANMPTNTQNNIPTNTSVVEQSIVSEENQNSTITLVAGEENEYAELLTLNAGTEFEKSQFVYYLPIGTYMAKNVSSYPSQINVYSRETHITEEGWEEPGETIFVKLLQVGESVELAIDDNQYIEIHKPDIIELQKIDNNEPVEQESIVPHREGEEIVGISDKTLDDVNILFDDSVRNDVTGNWRLARIAENNFNFAEYAVDYYNKYFKADNEVHAIVNFTTNTTTRINANSTMLFVSVYEYVPKEEHDAKILFGGQKLSDYIVYLDNGDIEKVS